VPSCRLTSFRDGGRLVALFANRSEQEARYGPSGLIRVYQGDSGMKRIVLTMCRAIVGLLMSAVVPAANCQAQPTGYQSPNFSEMAAATQKQPVFPAALLAGGPAAAAGNEYMDIYGKPIVLQTNYCQSCPSGYGGEGMGPPYVGGGDPMAVDFGGYGEDQVGPHYFDISAGVVFLQATELFDGVGSFGSVTTLANAPRILDPSGSGDDFEAGWEIAARYDIGPLSFLEATYMGVYDFGFSEQVVSTDVTTNPPNTPFALQSVFSGFGQNPIDGIDQGQVFGLTYDADLQSTEISFRRYWLGNNPRISGSWLLGARYLRFTEDLSFNTESIVVAPPTVFSRRTWSSENDLVGFQFGGDGWLALRQGLRIGSELKAGIYNNRFSFNHLGDFAGVGNAPADFNTTAKGHQVAFATEARVDVVADLFSSWSFRGGYEVIFLNSLATAGGNVVANDITSTAVLTQDHALFHGFRGGFEYIW